MSPGYASGAERPLILRIVDFPLVALFVAVLLFLFAHALGLYLGKFVPSLGNIGTLAVQAAIGIALISATYKLAIIRLGEEPRDDLRANGLARNIGLGLLIGAVLYSAVVGVAAVFGVYKVTAWGDASSVLSILIASAIVPAITEELLFRGILFRWIEDFAGTWAGLIVSSAVFGLAHIMNPGATWFSSFCVFVEAGLLLGGAYMLTQSLWMPIGLHAAWNFTQGAIFGVPVSGHVSNGLLRAELKGPTVVSGGSFGLEASVFALVLASAVGAWLVVLAVRGRAIVQPWWVRRRVIAPHPPA